MTVWYETDEWQDDRAWVGICPVCGQEAKLLEVYDPLVAEVLPEEESPRTCRCYPCWEARRMVGVREEWSPGRCTYIDACSDCGQEALVRKLPDPFVDAVLPAGTHNPPRCYCFVCFSERQDEV